jgi:hypothetical protein
VLCVFLCMCMYVGYFRFFPHSHTYTHTRSYKQATPSSLPPVASSRPSLSSLATTNQSMPSKGVLLIADPLFNGCGTIWGSSPPQLKARRWLRK